MCVHTRVLVCVPVCIMGMCLEREKGFLLKETVLSLVYSLAHGLIV